MPRKVFVSSGSTDYAQTISVGPHKFQADEPPVDGGKDVGPSAEELLMASLGACASITARMYAERKQWPLQGVQVSLSYAQVPAEGAGESGAKGELVNQFEVEISFTGDLNEGQRNRLFEIANRCPIHRMLVSQTQIHARPLAP